MLLRKSRWGLALLAASSFYAGSVQGQDADVVPVPTTVEPTSPPPVESSPPPQRLPSPSKTQVQDDIEKRVLERNRKRYVEPNTHDGDPWKKHPPVWSIRDDSKTAHPYAKPSTPAPGGGHYPGGPSGRWGIPYYYTATSPDTAYGPADPSAFLGAGLAGVGGAVPMGGPAVGGPPMHGPPVAGAPGAYGVGGYAGPGYGGPGLGGYASGGPGYGGFAGAGYGPGAGPYGQPIAALPGQLPGDPYLYHFGPGFYRHQEAGHYRFPYYSYRRPWYFPGHPSYNRDTNVPW